MAAAAESDPAIAARVQLFRMRVPEEFYDLEKDPDCLNNLIGKAEYQDEVARYRRRLESWMKRTGDPMLPALQNRSDRAKVDAVLLKTYGPPKVKKAKRKKTGNKRNAAERRKKQ